MVLESLKRHWKKRVYFLGNFPHNFETQLSLEMSKTFRSNLYDLDYEIKMENNFSFKISMVARACSHKHTYTHTHTYFHLDLTILGWGSVFMLMHFFYLKDIVPSTNVFKLYV